MHPKRRLCKHESFFCPFRLLLLSLNVCVCVCVVEEGTARLEGISFLFFLLWYFFTVIIFFSPYCCCFVYRTFISGHFLLLLLYTIELFGSCSVFRCDVRVARSLPVLFSLSFFFFFCCCCFDKFTPFFFFLLLFLWVCSYAWLFSIETHFLFCFCFVFLVQYTNSSRKSKSAL